MHKNMPAKLTAAFALCALVSACNSTPTTSLYLKGSMNDWSTSTPMTQDGHIYQVDIVLPKGEHQFEIADQSDTCGTRYGSDIAERLKLNRDYASNACHEEQPFTIKLFRQASYRITLDTSESNAALNIALSPKKPVALTPAITKTCPSWDGGEVTFSVGGAFAEGSEVVDFYSGNIATVANGKLTMTPAAQSRGLMLLEQANHQPSEFSWDNASVYFVMTDRFNNGDPSNDNSYGRTQDGDKEIGTFHGGDLKGLTQKLDYVADLGMTAIWITAPYEQVHGWVGGGNNGDFKHYAYHGYYVMDYTKLDANMGTNEDLQEFVDEAHARGIRVVFDIVMNHTGYATLADMQEYGFGGFFNKDKSPAELFGTEKWTDWKPKGYESWHDFNHYVNFTDENWMNWWGKDWIRTDIADYDDPGYDEITKSLAYLPDFKTESNKVVDLPIFYRNKKDTNAVKIEGYTVRDYITHWLSDWVLEYGIDGFRVDTAKHVELESWAALKTRSQQAFTEWKQANPDKVLDDNDFWMTGEVWAQGVARNGYFDSGFDSLINFDFQNEDAEKVMNCMADADEVYQHYASKINTDDSFNMLTYISSHDTKLAFGNMTRNLQDQKDIAAPFMFLPGAVQVYYGDESARSKGPSGSDPHQGTRSDMNWGSIQGPRADLLAHWQKVAQFRKRHVAIGAGQHQRLSEAPYVFSRTHNGDTAVVVWAGKL
ncbi:alpha-amylase [Echinimonas agarilytica]|uniref:Alpha-amylase n=1 Tax=Echinimonas agarilytica TaxID=1215918 RepID=A0AA41W8E7_9GAMM|nr:alpha-amylase [Echinimonas agarilytica]MCM2680346.1 alpha-amylase [Echinimonas agarilytica]